MGRWWWFNKLPPLNKYGHNSFIVHFLDICCYYLLPIYFSSSSSSLDCRSHHMMIIEGVHLLVLFINKKEAKRKHHEIYMNWLLSLYRLQTLVGPSHYYWCWLCVPTNIYTLPNNIQLVHTTTQCWRWTIYCQYFISHI